MFDVTGLGELLIDFTPSGRGDNGHPAFEMNPGGAPPNCLAALQALGARTAFIGMVGNDQFGDFLGGVMEGIGVDISGLSRTSEAPTTLAFVHLTDTGERSFSFVRKPGADILLQMKDVDFTIIDRTRIFHFGTLSLTDPPARDTTLYCLDYARSLGKTISYDPNYRPPLWESEAEAVKWMRKGLEYADIIKLSEEELALITDTEDIPRGAALLAAKGIETVFVTMGEKGAYYLDRTGSGYVPGFAVKAVDTTGCGDAFTGAALYMLLYEQKPIAEVVRFANAAGALCATKKGGIPAMPDKDAIIKLIESA
jgi:fructokinase